jgi:hypothetical protein
MTTILVSGPIANKPYNGGNAWAHLSYVLGFLKLGFDVYFVEKIHPSACIHEDGSPAPIEASVNRRYFRRTLEEFGLVDRMALISPDLRTVEGVAFHDLLDIAESAALLVNISGHLDVEALTKRVRCKAFIDLDPGFTQFWHANSNNGFAIGGHDYYFTVGENIGAPDCPIPSNEIRWRRMRQPVVLDEWPVCTEGDSDRFTTIATWRGPFGPVSYNGHTFGSKVREFRKYAGIPLQTKARFEIALNIHSADDPDRELLCRNSWRLSNPLQVAPDLGSFRGYVQSSGAEFSVAQEMYVGTNSGWFSDRTVRYLASGKPVLVQETGFSRNYPVGVGLLTFSTPDEAVVGVREITENYSEHAAAARCIAEQYFDSDRVLGSLLDEMEISV